MSNKKNKSICTAIRLIWNMDKWLLIYSIGASLLESVIPFFGIILSAHILDGLQAGENMTKLLIVAVSAVGTVFLLTVLKSFLDKLKNVHTDICGKKYDTLMSIKTISMDFPLLDSPMANDIRTRINHDNNWGAGFYSLVWQLPWVLNNMFTCLISIAFMVPLFIKSDIFADVTAILLLLVFLSVIVSNVFIRYNKSKKLFVLLDDTTLDKSYFSHYLWKTQDYHYGKDIRLYRVKPLIQSKLDGDVLIKNEWTEKIVCNNMQSGFYQNFFTGILQVISYVFVAFRAVAGALTAGSVVKYAGVIYKFSQSASNVFGALREYALSSNRQMSTLEFLNIEDVLKKGTLPVEKRAFCDGGDNDYEIEFRDVSFQYPGSDVYALRHINLKFHIGERLAVVGMNGSGKTTFIKLLCRLYDPAEGEILLNGINIKKYDYEEYMRIFSVVFQDFSLFSFSLGQNVAASMKYDRKRAETCLRKAGFGERLDAMPKGLNTCLYKDFEEDGVEISGGEAQKIALARALYKNAPFIVLDEPTAALDPIAEAEVYSKFNELVGDKTAIYISHRLSSCRFCDEIVVFDHGQIVQQGSHDQLVIDESGKYHELWHAQAQYYKK